MNAIQEAAPRAPVIPGWEVIQPAIKKGALAPVIRVSASPVHGRYRPALLITINPIAWSGGPMPPWIAAGRKLWVMRGLGEFAGQLRLVPNGTVEVRKAPRGMQLTIRVPAIAGQPSEGAAATSVEFDWSDGWLDITLPAWMKVTSVPAGRTSISYSAASPQITADGLRTSPATIPPSPKDLAAPAAAPARKPVANAQPYVLGGGVASHPGWLSPKGRAEHEAALARAKGEGA